jgi:hypothetical protein
MSAGMRPRVEAAVVDAARATARAAPSGRVNGRGVGQLDRHPTLRQVPASLLLHRLAGHANDLGGHVAASTDSSTGDTGGGGSAAGAGLEAVASPAAGLHVAQ